MRCAANPAPVQSPSDKNNPTDLTQFSEETRAAFDSVSVAGERGLIDPA
jgi:hypothetical protein